MGDYVRTYIVGKGQKIKLPRRPADLWLNAGQAWLCPLHLKRRLLIDEGDTLYAWTLHRVDRSTEEWRTAPNPNAEAVFPVKVSALKDGTYEFYCAAALHQRAWLPERGGIVMFEILESGQEINIWLPHIFNIQKLREAETE